MLEILFLLSIPCIILSLIAVIINNLAKERSVKNFIKTLLIAVIGLYIIDFLMKNFL